MFGNRVRCLAMACLILLLPVGAMVGLLPAPTVAAQAGVERKARIRPSPVFPEVAKKLKLAGIVRIEVTVAPNGSVVSTKAVGGHPVLVEAAMDALKKWRFEPGPQTTTEIIPFEFKPSSGL